MLGRGNPRDNQRDNPRFSRHPSPRDAKSVGRLEYAAATSIGKLRSNNEDAYLLDEPLFAVADGMGGHAAGEIAANLAITTLKESPDDPTQPDILRQMVMAANVEVLEAPVKGYGRAGMGTTLTAAAIQNDRLLIAQVGDSRAYLLHDGQLRRLTRDHSMVQELLNAGEISEDEVREHPQRGIITRVLGYEYETQPDIYELRLEAGDRLLLCSDGLHGMIDDSEIAAMLLTCHPAQQCADTLVQAANAAGGLDNTTVVVIDIHALAAPANPGRRGLRLGIIGFLLAFTLLVGGSVAGIWWYASHSAYLIAEDGQVVIYRGLVGDVFGFRLQWREADTGIKVDDLDAPLPDRLRQGIQLGSLDDAEKLVRQYQQQIDRDKP